MSRPERSSTRRPSRRKDITHPMSINPLHLCLLGALGLVNACVFTGHGVAPGYVAQGAAPTVIAFHQVPVIATTSEAHPTTSAVAGLDRRGGAGGLYTFNGLDGQVAFNDARLPTGAHPRTLSVWFQTSDATGAHVIANWGNATVGQRFGLLVDAGRVKLVGEFQDLMSEHTFADGCWHHAAATFDGARGAVWVDGVMLTSGPLALNTAGSTLVIGNAPSNHSPEWWRGSIADVRVYARVLSPPELSAAASL